MTGLDGDRAPAPVSQRTRTYEGRRGDQKARHTISVYASERDAITVFTALANTLRARCGVNWPTDRDIAPSGSAADPLIHKFFVRTSHASPEDVEVVPMRSGTRVAVVQVAGIDGFAREYIDGVADHCLSVSLWRTQPSASPSPSLYKNNPEEAARRC
ncbi:hypothetical protein [Streptomyces sp. XD-27]|uniref:hypothetical protein n=1 Tax=Streptomyces sp. XD-27 TaxID=3062779 RepID=UPI0026F4412F|nr:hypothetical protein [Streptomyces sp. XD-27]WKX71197.1 hypothetical protein Q3Y56_15900 [Streptomyces sp. XD-27]